MNQKKRKALHTACQGFMERSLHSVPVDGIEQVVHEEIMEFGITVQESELRIQNSGGFVPKLSVWTKLVGDKIHVEIEDKGPGIPEEIKDKILQPFFTKKGTQGTGAGIEYHQRYCKSSW